MDISIRPSAPFDEDFDSDEYLDEDEDDSDHDVVVEELQMATLSTTPPDNSNDEVTVVGSGLAAGPSDSRMTHPRDEIVVPETEDKTDDEVTVVSFRPAAGPNRSLEY
jgi:hypothetical protein